MLDIVIPVLNEEACLKENSGYYSQLKHHAQLIFIDGGSVDKTVEVAKCYGEVHEFYPSRALQKNYGAAQAKSPYLLFLNVDCQIDPNIIANLPKYLDKSQVGCFTMKIDDAHWIYRFYERVVNFRARSFNVTDADLGLFIKRELFVELGQFDQLEIMDDIAFSRKLAKEVRFTPLKAKILVSSRRWREDGFFKTLGLYCLAYVQFWTGIPLVKQAYGRST